MITLAVDAMGGDAGLSVTVPGAVAFLKKQANARLIMVGDEAALTQALRTADAPMDRIEIQAASEIVSMDESPQLALKNKKDSSMRVAINQVKENKAQAAVSAGNTGALMATARFVLKTIPGIERPAIAKFIPTSNQKTTLLLDLGANVDCSAAQLAQFAILGSELVAALQLHSNPRVGLLNVGTEDIKGTETVKEAYALLKKSGLNFFGNVEGNVIFSGDADVIVSDGFVGNIVLKTIEGAVGFMEGAVKQQFQANLFTKAAAVISLPALKGLKAKLDPRRFNGAIFLGLQGVVVKSHGGTDAVGFYYALEEAYHEARADSLTKIKQGVEMRLDSLTTPKTVAENDVLAG